MSGQAAAAEALERLQDSFAAAAAVHAGDPPKDWGEQAELQRRFPPDSQEVVNLNAISEEQLPLSEGSVCRFLCCVRQPLNAECFVGALCREGRWFSSKFRESLPEAAAASSKSVIWSRHAFRCSLIPGVASWWQQQQQQQQQQPQQQQQRLAVRECMVLFYPAEGEPLPKLNEVIDVTGFCWGGSLVATDRFVSFSNACLCGAAGAPRPCGNSMGPSLLRLHAFSLRRLLRNSPERPLKVAADEALADSWEERRQRAISFLKDSFDGDSLAAEYALLAICSRPMPQQAGLPLHRLRVSFLRPPEAETPGTEGRQQQQQQQQQDCGGAVPCEEAAAAANAAAAAAPESCPCVCPFLTRESRRLLRACRELVPCSTAVSVHPEALLQQRLSPQLQLSEGDVSEDFLSAAPLQLSAGCVLIVEESHSLERPALQSLVRRRAAAAANQQQQQQQQQQQKQQMEASLLQEIACSVSALQALISDGIVPYDFLSGVCQIPTDCCLLLFAGNGRDSHFNELIKVPLVTANNAKETQNETQRETPEGLEALRQFVSAAREIGDGVKLHSEIHQKAVDDFVQKRQQHEDISSDDFQQWLLLAAAVAASCGSFVVCTPEESKERKETQILKTDSAADKAKVVKVVVKLTHWQHAQQLENERRRRLRFFKEMQKIQKENYEMNRDVEAILATAAKLTIN